ncbi:glutamate receptor 2-like isoform X2 [Penaeus chinensis]|uniref:glutamate receptor 2-like isoform X2 n=1 Tax=Penaeus chinensis TaxID=139456 RepID=UPI001FB7E338|nr:glutamate receptor 2-like isoform X2 [Penaeus chinensis]
MAGSGYALLALVSLSCLTNSPVGANKALTRPTEAEATSSTTGTQLRNYVLEVLSGMRVKNVVIITSQSFDADQSNNPAKFHNKTAKEERFTWESVNWKFLDGRGPVHKSETATVVLGPATWAVMSAIEVVSRFVLGRWDSLLVVPVGEASDIYELPQHVQLGTRVAVIQQRPRREQDEKQQRCSGTVKEARLVGPRLYALHSVGCWRNGQLSLEPHFLRPINSFMGSTLKAGTLKGIQDVIIKHDGDKVVYDGVLGSFFMHVNANLNISMEFFEHATVGGLEPDGTASGLLGALYTRSADFCAVTLSMIPARAQVIEYSICFLVYAAKFMTKLPQAMEDQFLLFKIFRWQVWCSILGFLCLSSIILTMVWGLLERENSLASTSTKHIRYAVTATFKASVYMGSSHLPKSSSARIIMTCTWLVVIMLVTVYSGNLTAFLSIPRMSRVPNTVREMIDMGYDMSIGKGYSQYNKMKSSPIEDHQYIFRTARFRQDVGLTPDQRVVQEVLTERVALLVSIVGIADVQDANSETVGAEQVCRLKAGTEPLFIQYGAIAYSQNSPLKELMDRQLLLVMSGDLVKYPPPKCRSDIQVQKEKQPLGIVIVSGVLTLWAVGIVLSVLLFLVEITFYASTSD